VTLEALCTSLDEQVHRSARGHFVNVSFEENFLLKLFVCSGTGTGREQPIVGAGGGSCNRQNCEGRARSGSSIAIGGFELQPSQDDD
jgi:hypothetical protein